MRASLFAVLALLTGCAAIEPAYDSYDDVEYGYQMERTIWGKRSKLDLRVAELPAANGNEAATPVLMLHPWGFNMRVWGDVAPALAADRRVLLLDLPGHGKSSKLRTKHSMARLAAAALDALDAFGVQKAYLIGNSLGGATALAVGIAAPERVAGLVLIAAPGGRPFPLFLRNGVRQLATPNEIGSLSLEAWWLGVSLMGTGDGQLGHRVREDLVRLTGAREHRAFARESSHILERVAEYAPEAPGLHLPALIVHAGDDLLIWRSNSEAMQKKIPGAELIVLEDCAHMVELDCPERLLDVVRPFLDRSAPP